MQLFYFTAPWCVPCKTFGPVMDALETDVPIIKVNVDDHQEMATYYNIFSVPTVLAIRDDEELGRFSGSRDKFFVERFISSFA